MKQGKLNMWLYKPTRATERLSPVSHGIMYNENKMKNRIFYLGVGLLFTHELDAMINHEWRVLPLTSWLPEDFGRTIFILIHIPLFAVLVGLISSQNEVIRRRTKFWVSAFLAIHGVLHAAFIIHERYEFESLLSNVLIFGGSICGFLYLVINQRSSGNST